MAKQVSPQKTNAKTKPATEPINVQAQNKGLFTKVPSVRVLWIILGIIGFLAYSNTLNHSFVLDDLMVVHGNNYVKNGMGSIPDLLKTPYLSGYVRMPNDVYRPLSLITFAIEVQLMGVNPSTNHFGNVLLFAGCVIFLFLFLYNLFEVKKTGVAVVATLLFALHPIHTEVVANVKSRDELLCFFFAFVSLYLFVKYAQGGKITALVFGGLCYFLSLVSKETSIALLGIVPLVFLLFINNDKKRSIGVIVTAVLSALLFLGIRTYVLKINHADDPGYLHFIDNQLVNAHGVGEKLGTSFLVLAWYLKLLVLPNPLICSYAFNSVPTVGLSNPFAIIGLLVYLGMAGFAIFRLVKFKKDYWALAILFYIFTLGIFTNLFFLIGSVMSERFLFFASVGFCLILALLLEFFLNRKSDTPTDIFLNNRTWMIVVPVALVLGFLTHNRNEEWKDNYTLFQADVQKNPENARLNFYLGNEMATNYAAQAPDPLTKKQIMENAITYLKKAVAIYPHFYDAHQALASAYFNTQQYDSAEFHDNLTLADDPQNTLAFNGLAGIYFMKQNFPAARNILIRDIAVNPNPDIVQNLGICYTNMKMYDSSIYYFKMAISINRQHKASLENLARTYMVVGNTDSARKYEALAREVDPGFKL